jgi:TRAP-type C4-dicarboxylate transport system substrate-binding protein
MTGKQLSQFTAPTAALAAALLWSGAVAAQTGLRVADSFPTGHYIAENQTKPWMEKVKELTGGKVGFQYFPAEQLGKAKDLLSLTQTGVVDIGYVAPSFVGDKLPLAAVAELPEAFSTSCQGTMAFWNIAKPGGALDKIEFAPNGMRALFVLVLPPYQLYMAKDNITSLDAAKGKKIRTSGGAKELAVRAIGATPVQIPTPEVREAVARGTVDGMLFPHSSTPPYDLTKQVKYATIGENFGSFIVTYMISLNKWNALPADIRKAMDEAGDWATQHGCKIADEREAADIEKLKAGGVTFVKLSDADHKQLEEKLAGVSQEWAKGLDKRGKKGSEILTAFKAGLKAKN